MAESLGINILQPQFACSRGKCVARSQSALTGNIPKKKKPFTEQKVSHIYMELYKSM